MKTQALNRKLLKGLGCRLYEDLTALGDDGSHIPSVSLFASITPILLAIVSLGCFYLVHLTSKGIFKLLFFGSKRGIAGSGPSYTLKAKGSRSFHFVEKKTLRPTSTPQLPSIIPEIPTIKDHKGSTKRYLGGCW